MNQFNLILTWAANCVISNAAANQNATFAITDTKLYVPYVPINWNKYDSKTEPLNVPIPYLEFWIDPIF